MASMMESREDTRLMDFPDSTEEIPLLDISDYMAGEPGAAQRIGAELRQISETVGFFYLAGHSVDQGLVDAAFREVKKFHALPLETKMKVKIEDNSGYLAMNGVISRVSNLIDAAKPNLNAAFLFSHERGPDHPDVVNKRRFRSMNRWPEELPSFREAMLKYFAAVEVLGQKMLPLWSAALDMPENFFVERFQDPHMTMRVSHYPPQPEETVGTRQYGLAPHTDNCMMTILAQANVPGLAVEMPSGHWRIADIIPGTFLVNTGNLVVRWTNDRFKSTKHRVINTSGTDRYSIPVFIGPHPDTMIECLPSCVKPGEAPKYPPISYEDFMIWYFNKKQDARKFASPDDYREPAA